MIAVHTQYINELLFFPGERKFMDLAEPQRSKEKNANYFSGELAGSTFLSLTMQNLRPFTFRNWLCLSRSKPYNGSVSLSFVPGLLYVI
jgi:hypothetical protein